MATGIHIIIPDVAQYYGTGGGPLALRAIAFSVSGSIGYIIGGYASHAGQPDAGKFTLTIREGGDGRWLIFSDMDNSNHARRGTEGGSGAAPEPSEALL